jgi:hypothetical protein
MLFTVYFIIKVVNNAKGRREFGKCSVIVSDRGDRGLFVVCGFHVINIFPCPLTL